MMCRVGRANGSGAKSPDPLALPILQTHRIREPAYGVSIAADGSFFTCSMLSVMIFVISITDWLSAA